jgi:hypothetical protein
MAQAHLIRDVPVGTGKIQEISTRSPWSTVPKAVQAATRSSGSREQKNSDELP